MKDERWKMKNELWIINVFPLLRGTMGEIDALYCISMHLKCTSLLAEVILSICDHNKPLMHELELKNLGLWVFFNFWHYCLSWTYP